MVFFHQFNADVSTNYSLVSNYSLHHRCGDHCGMTTAMVVATISLIAIIVILIVVCSIVCIVCVNPIPPPIPVQHQASEQTATPTTVQ